MSDTPKTDAALCDFARKLERELDDANQARDRMGKKIAELLTETDRLERELADALEKRDRLAEFIMYQIIHDEMIESAKHAARRILVSVKGVQP